MVKHKKLLFISTRAFWKLDGGHQYEIYHYLRGLSEKYSYDVYVYTFVNDPEADNDSGIPGYVKEVFYASRINKGDILKNICLHFFDIRNPWSLQNLLFYSKKNNERLKKLVDEIQPDVIYVDMIRLASYINAFSKRRCLKVLGYDDLLSERYKRQKLFGNTKSNIAGAYTDKLPYFVSKLQNIDFFKKIILTLEAKRIEKNEIYYSDKYDAGIFVSGIETKKFNDRIGRNMAYTVSMGIDYAYQSGNIPIQYIPNSISFIGNMRAAANYETLIYIIEKILPYVKNKYTFYVIGICPEELKNKYIARNDIVFKGMVDDLRPVIRATDVFLSPIAFGSGIKTKILEAFAMGMAVVTNSVGIEGIEADDGIHCRIADDPLKIAEHVDNLLSDTEYRKMLGRNAQQLAKEKYQWEKNWEGFAKAGF